MKISLLRYAGVSCLVAAVFWVWAVVNTYRLGFPDSGVVTFLLVIIANSFLYRHVTKTTEMPVPKCITICVTLSGCLVTLSYLGGLALALAHDLMGLPGEVLDEFNVGIGFAVYCGSAAAVWTVWTILGLCWMRATVVSDSKPAAAAEDQEPSADTENV